MARGCRAPAVFAAGLLALALVLQRSAADMSIVLGYDTYTVFALPFTSRTAHANARLEDVALLWLNRARRAQQLPPLHAEAAIKTIARGYGREMFAHGYLSHVSRDGRTLEDRLAAGGLQPQVAGENLAYARTLADAERALWQSEPHRRNILYPAFQTVGLAVIDGGDKGLIVVQDFAGDQPAEDSLAPGSPRPVFSALGRCFLDAMPAGPAGAEPQAMHSAQGCGPLPR
jgi:uncharacterized protein YkwD